MAAVKGTRRVGRGIVHLSKEDHHSLQEQVRVALAVEGRTGRKRSRARVARDAEVSGEYLDRLTGEARYQEAKLRRTLSELGLELEDVVNLR